MSTALDEPDVAKVDPAAASADAVRGSRPGWPFWSPLIVLVVGLVVTAVLTSLSAAQYTHNERRLLVLRARDVGAVLTTALPSIQTPLASATALANATGGNVAKFAQLVSQYVGRGRPFVSIALWRRHAPASGPVAIVGSPPLMARPDQAARFFTQASAAPTKLEVIGYLARPPFRLGYAYAGMSKGPFIAYAEAALPPDRYVPSQSNAAFNDINYALYLGRRTNPARLLIASVHRLPLNGRQTTVHVPFGDTSFAVTVAARGSLAGSLPQQLPWILAVAGTVLTVGATLLTLRLVQRRRHSERLALRLAETAEENRQLYAEQRDIAQTLQHALLPEELPELPGLQVGARYQAGAEGVEIGGDWYDLIELGARRLLLVVGDVSGRGLRAAATMASLRFAIKAYAAQGDHPEAILSKLSGLVSVSADGQLATVLCAVVDVGERTVTVANAGHLPPLLIGEDHSEFIEAPVGVPVGVDHNPTYSSNTVVAPSGATLLAFTDGLVERRGESIEVGLERLRRAVSPNHTSLDGLLEHVLEDVGEHSADDTAIAGIRWLS